MKLLGHGKGRVVAIAAYRGSHFQGYAVRTAATWVCIASLGMSWSRLNCRTVEDARATLRATCHAARFESFDEIDDLRIILANLPPFQQPAITLEQIDGLPTKLPKLSAG